MTKFVSLLMIFLIVIQTQSVTILQTFYNYNTSYFSSKCENKPRLQLKCNGKCQLNKSISKLTQPKSKSKHVINVISFEYLKAILSPLPRYFKRCKKNYIPFLAKKTTSPIFFIFCPPKINII